MKRILNSVLFTVLCFLAGTGSFAQVTNPAPYCTGTYGSGQCNQPGPSNSPGNFINDFINNFSTTGANTNISNLNSGCNGGPNNYMMYCSHYLAVSPNQTITCTLSSGITFAQGFAIWVDWNQDNTFNLTNEFVAASAGVPAPGTPTTISFVIPANQPNGTYRMRVKCAFATPGTGITPCGNFGFGEVEDYLLFVGPVPPSSAVPDGTASVTTPVCVGQPLNFTLSTTYQGALTFTWTGPNGFNNNTQNPTIPSPTTQATGIYTVVVSNQICPITRTVAALVVAYPTFTPVSNTYVICQGGNIVATASMVPQNATAYTFSWTSTSGAAGQIFNPQMFSTTVKPATLHPLVTQSVVVYSVKVSPTLNLACSRTQTIGILINNPPQPTLTMPANMCDISNGVQLIATPGGGTWSANPAVSATGWFNPAMAAIGTNTVVYSASIGNCVTKNWDTLSVSKFHTAALSSSIVLSCVLDQPFNLMNIVQDPTTGHWTGTNVSNNHFNPAGLATGNYNLVHHTFSTPIGSVCPATTVFVVPVFNPPTPTITPIAPLCNNSPTVILTAVPLSGTWTSNNGVSTSGVRTPSLNNIGDNNTVMYTAGIGTCVASSSATFHTSKFNTAFLTSSIPPLCITSKPVNLMAIVQNTTGTWSGPNVNGSLFTPGALPSGIYTMRYNTWSSPIKNLCPDSSKVAIDLLNPPIPTIKKVGPYCSVGAPVQLSVTPSAGGAWVQSPFLDAKGVFSPSLAAIGENPVQYMVGTSTCNVHNSTTIKVEAFVSSALTGAIEDQCNTGLPMSLVPYTQNSTGTWFGPGLTGSTFNPGLTGSGKFTLTYKTASYPSGLCPDQTTVAVNVFSLAPPVITPVEPLCNSSQPLQLQVSPVGGFFDGSSYGAVSLTGLFNPAFAIPGDNFINYTISVGPCKSQAQVKIHVESFVPAAFSKMPDPAYCRNQEPFNLNSLALYPVGSWSGGPGLEGANMFNPKTAYLGTNVILYRTSSISGLCPDVDTLFIRVKEPEDVKPSASSYLDCAPMQVGLNTQNINYGKFTWNISDGSRHEGANVEHLFKSPGSYSVLLSYQDQEAPGCITQVRLPLPIVVSEAPRASFSPNPAELSLDNPVTILMNESSVLERNKYEWRVEGREPVYGLHPQVKFTAPGSYNITLVATSVDGCKSEITKTIDVKNDFGIHIPNSFTPNYDGLNDTFIPVFTLYGLDSKSFSMQIYDRWGHRLYTTNDSTKGWDGNVENGDAAKQETYVYTIRYKDLDGKLYTKTGHVNLLR